MATYFSDKDLQDYAAAKYGYTSPADLTPEIAVALLADAERAGVSAEQMAAALGGGQIGAEQVSQAAADQGYSLPTLQESQDAAIESAFNQQYGRDPTAEEYAYSRDFLTGGGDYQVGLGNLNRTLEGYNYDTSDVMAGLRQELGRAPTQEEFVTAMANLGLANYPRTAAESQQVTTLYQNALEADPFGGRYATTNPYIAENQYGTYFTPQRITADLEAIKATGVTGDDYAKAVGDWMVRNGVSVPQLLTAYDDPNLTASAVNQIADRLGYDLKQTTDTPLPNVSQTVGGNYVQYTNPVTQSPMVATIENGQLVVRSGTETYSAADAARQLETALNFGNVDEADVKSIVDQLKGATTIDEVRDIFSQPKAYTTLDPTFGFQLGSGKTLEQAQANNDIVLNALNSMGGNLEGQMPSVFSIADYINDPSVYPYTQQNYNARGSTLMTPANVVTPANIGQFIGQNVGYLSAP